MSRKSILAALALGSLANFARADEVALPWMDAALAAIMPAPRPLSVP